MQLETASTWGTDDGMFLLHFQELVQVLECGELPMYVSCMENK